MYPYYRNFGKTNKKAGEVNAYMASLDHCSFPKQNCRSHEAEDHPENWHTLLFEPKKQNRVTCIIKHL